MVLLAPSAAAAHQHHRPCVTTLAFTDFEQKPIAAYT
jgi:hypothetical protein